MTICSECNEPCEGAKVDFGIGSYEYWGAQCVDTNIQYVSKCCEAPMHDENGILVEWEDDDEL